MNIGKKIIIKTLSFLIGKDKYFRVFFGPLKGMNWIYSSGYKSYWTGEYENPIVKKYISFLSKNSVVYDLGAHIGYYSLCTSKITQNKIYAFEPFKSNFKLLNKHIEINKIKNINTFNIAISDVNGKTNFSDDDNNSANSIISSSPMFKDNNSVEIKTNSLDYLVEKENILPPDLIKMDIEGAELKALTGAKNLLKKHKPVIFLSTHNCQLPGVHKKCIDFLTEYGYDIEYLNFHTRETEYDDPWYELIAK